MNPFFRRLLPLFISCQFASGCAGGHMDPKVLFSSSAESMSASSAESSSAGEAGKEETAKVPYRIPAIASSSHGTLVAVADYRHCRYDIGYGRVDLHARVSRDNGRTWGGEMTVAEGTGVPSALDCGFGDAALVCDRLSSELLLIAVCGNTVYWHDSTNRLNPNRMVAFRSTDGGEHWSGHEEITEDVYQLFDDSPRGCVQSCFVTSGRICQSRTVKVGSHYRVYAALCARPNGNRVIYSDDFGHSWKALGGADSYPVPYGDEAKCEELPDGTIVLSSRAFNGRYFNLFRYSDIGSGCGTWSEAAFSGADNDGCTALDNACNGELLLVRAKRASDGVPVNLLLQSIPLGPERTNVGIYHKVLPDDLSSLTPSSIAASWDGPYKVSDTSSAYSTMVLQSNGTIGFFYEESINADCTGYDMVYRPLTISSITGGLYR